MIGIDIVSIGRISRLKERHGELFLRRFLSEEAASKALGVGIGAECSFFDIIIEKSPKNAPILKFSPKIYENFNIKEATLSISHDAGFAIAVAIVS